MLKLKYDPKPLTQGFEDGLPRHQALHNKLETKAHSKTNSGAEPTITTAADQESKQNIQNDGVSAMTSQSTPSVAGSSDETGDQAGVGESKGKKGKKGKKEGEEAE